MENAVDLSEFKFDERYMALVRAQTDLHWLATEFARLKREKDELDERLSEINKAFDFVRIQVIPEKMDDANVRNVVYADLGRVQLTADAHVRILPDQKQAAYQMLDDLGMGDLIQPYVQPSTLKSAVMKIYAAGEMPDGFDQIFDVQPFRRASITKIGKSGQ